MARPHIAIAACRAAGEAEGLYPDPDGPLLAEALDDAGIDATALAWDAAGVDWARFDVVVVRSTWNSVDRPAEFVDWARGAAASTVLLNPLAAIEWNLDKTYLRRLAARGVRTVPTEWVLGAADWRPPAQEFVVKPSISGGGRETARYRPEEAAAATAHVRRLGAAGRTVMVQPYVASVDVAGETKLVYVAGRLSHAVRVGPQLAAGAGVPERPWERLGRAERAEPTADERATGEGVLAAVAGEVPAPLLYARVDLMAGAGGEPLLGEVELIDPSLFLRLHPPAARRLAVAIRAVVA
jgi:glutathione synthase/RimK-type ligase-like ATP-grasp enzyme